jgi:hypothetical protein
MAHCAARIELAVSRVTYLKQNGNFYRYMAEMGNLQAVLKSNAYYKLALKVFLFELVYLKNVTTVTIAANFNLVR